MNRAPEARRVTRRRADVFPLGFKVWRRVDKDIKIPLSFIKCLLWGDSTPNLFLTSFLKPSPPSTDVDITNPFIPVVE